jgi:hypothetical protein
MIIDELSYASPLSIIITVQSSCKQALRRHQSRSIVGQLRGYAANGLDAFRDCLFAAQVFQVAAGGWLMHK